jgi:hypothetical protein
MRVAAFFRASEQVREHLDTAPGRSAAFPGRSNVRTVKGHGSVRNRQLLSGCCGPEGCRSVSIWTLPPGRSAAFPGRSNVRIVKGHGSVRNRQQLSGCSGPEKPRSGSYGPLARWQCPATQRVHAQTLTGNKFAFRCNIWANIWAKIFRGLRPNATARLTVDPRRKFRWQ